MAEHPAWNKEVPGDRERETLLGSGDPVSAQAQQSWMWRWWPLGLVLTATLALATTVMIHMISGPRSPDEIFNENGDALKRSMNPFAKPSKLIEKDFSSDSYSGDEDSINPDFRAKKDLGLNKMIDGDDGLQKLDEELQASIVDGLAQDASYQLRNTAAKLVNSDSATLATNDDEFNRLLTESETPVMSMPKSQEEREAELLSKKWDSFPEKDGKKPALTV